MTNDNHKKDKLKAAGMTIAIHLGLLVFLFFASMSFNLAQKPEEEGVPVMLGYVPDAGGDDEGGSMQPGTNNNAETPDEEVAERLGWAVSRVKAVKNVAREPISLETPIGEEEDSHLGDFIPDEDAPAPAEAAAFSMLKEQLVEVLNTLTEREQKVLKLRFGLEDGRARTLEEVGKEFDVTRERIRQIEAKALRKLRHPTRSKKLKDYLE